jgi:hypothetical protein
MQKIKAKEENESKGDIFWEAKYHRKAIFF